jgi:uncharacterized membrane-anchored protein
MTLKMKKEMIESTHESKEARIREEAKKEKDKNRILNENRKREKDEAEMNNNAKEKQLTKRMGTSNRPTRRGVQPESHISAQSVQSTLAREG